MKFLTIGHCCLDKKQNHWIPGGATTYGLRVANQLNIPSTLLTSIASDFDTTILKPVEIINVLTPHTTKFHNQETPNGRQQILEQVATSLFPSALQKKFQSIPMVHICPIAQEVDISFLDYFLKETMICLSPQGWLRKWNIQGQVSHINFNDYHLWKRANIVVLSQEEIGDSNPNVIAENFEYFILTKGGEGAELFYENRSYKFPVYPVEKVVDTTGAGDVFAAAFLFKLVETDDPILAMRFASRCAACCVGAEGVGFHISWANIQM